MITLTDVESPFTKIKIFHQFPKKHNGRLLTEDNGYFQVQGNKICADYVILEPFIILFEYKENHNYR